MSEHFDPAPHYEPKQAPKTLQTVALVLTVIGLLSLVAGLFVGDAKSVKGALLVNIIYFWGLTMGGLIFCCVQTLTLARWGRPLKRLAESLVLFSPVVLVMTVVFFAVGGLELYEWHTHPEVLHGHKAIWLTDGFFMSRNLFIMALLCSMGVIYVRMSLRADLSVASKELDGKHPDWWKGYIQDDADQAVEDNQRSMMTLSPFIVIAYALGMSFFIFDMSMSLAPHWYANMFGGWFFTSSFWLGMVWTGLISLSFRDWLGIRKLMTPKVYHDLGKLVLAFSMAWAYMFYAQLLPIWYGNMTEEIGFLLVRMQLEPWTYLARVVGCMCFLIPFTTLLSRGIKKMPLGFFIILTVVAVGVWLERFIVAVPSFWHEESIPLGPFELGITAGFVGGLLLVVTRFLSKVPPVTVSDPYMQPNPADVHVVPAGASH